MRGFASPLDKVLFNSKMQRATLEALLEAMKEYLPNFHQYLRAKAEAMGHKNGLPWYDLFAPVAENSATYTVEEAKAYLMNIFENCNPRMAEIADRAFEEEWIDFFPREGKVGGAFCAGVESAKQFRILTNYDGSFSDVVTLAHELGHGYHDFMIYVDLHHLHGVPACARGLCDGPFHRLRGMAPRPSLLPVRLPAHQLGPGCRDVLRGL